MIQVSQQHRHLGVIHCQSAAPPPDQLGVAVERHSKLTGADEGYGAAWLRQTLPKGTVISPAGERVADFCNWLFDGIYHEEDAMRKVDWSHPHYIVVRARWQLSTFDASSLTRLVVGAHDRAIRVEINPCNFNLLEFVFYPRERSGDRRFQYHPTIEEALLKTERFDGLL